MEDSYKIENENLDQTQKKSYWDTGIGLQKVDDLEVSNELLKLKEENINNKLSYNQVEEKINKYYNQLKQEKINEIEGMPLNEKKEADLVSTRIVQILSSKSFVLSTITLKDIHKKLFDGIINNAGEFRKYNITKEEPILNEHTVIYADYSSLEDYLNYDISEEKKFNINKENIVEHITKFTSDIWQVHPFSEGNTRTTAIFIEKYINSLGYNINNSLFKDNSKYYRNSLVIANYSDIQKNIYPNFEFLKMFYENLLENRCNKLSNEDMFLKQLFKNNSEEDSDEDMM